jgi:hypothetical protein
MLAKYTNTTHKHYIVWPFETYQKSPRMVLGALSSGLVAPSIFRPVATASFPSQTCQSTNQCISKQFTESHVITSEVVYPIPTMQTTGPLSM